MVLVDFMRGSTVPVRREVKVSKIRKSLQG